MYISVKIVLNIFAPEDARVDDGLKRLTLTNRLRAEHVVWIQAAGRSDQMH